MEPIPSGYINQGQLATDVERAKLKLGTEVVRVRHNVGADTSGDPSLFFRVILKDSSIREDTLADLTGQIAAVFFDELRPYENWGLIPYFSFRSESEQSQRNDLEWN